MFTPTYRGHHKSKPQPRGGYKGRLCPYRSDFERLLHLAIGLRNGEWRIQDGRRKKMVEFFGNRVQYATIRNWLRGYIRIPSWAIDRLLQHTTNQIELASEARTIEKTIPKEGFRVQRRRSIDVDL
jgi:hypothetical protein